ncbi:iron chelate uptake ABC transporter family permease subunit [Microbacterium sp. SORGH_AS_0888]|uniref:iron chelate uptake ABC transporter family permease subunit n=1 Tax=Microbacterium sp. SORGH_AS_0888 TaxID=3041791 RepID=UPI00277ED28E|nr:iron chelate uptake ABC transporter family permease subunit [Microbacterium sp. SORGH_AS_0888]MDQ1128142.1 iron complex transport system permease protein [Microbacterium sp. SORGH_AS_0888]
MTTLPSAVPRVRSPARRRGRVALGVLGLAAVLPLAVVLSLTIGSNPLSPGSVLEVLRGGGAPDARYIVAELRIPRTIAGLVVGAALGAAGALIQAFTRNPLADPGILGVNAGAAFAVALGVGVFGLREISAFVWLAFAGALAVTVAVYLIGSAGRAADPIRLTLAGVALGAVFAGMTTGMTLSNPDAFDQMRSWNAGSLLGRGLDVLLPVLPFLAVGIALALALAPGLNALALGDDVARAQGANVTGIRIGVIAAVTLLAGAATALAGPIAFVGLMVPHVARWLFGVDQRRILVVSLLLAPAVVLLSDVLGRVLIAPAEIPVGIVTAFVGAPVLIALARRRSASAPS